MPRQWFPVSFEMPMIRGISLCAANGFSRTLSDRGGVFGDFGAFCHARGRSPRRARRREGVDKIFSRVWDLTPRVWRCSCSNIPRCYSSSAPCEETRPANLGRLFDLAEIPSDETVRQRPDVVDPVPLDKVFSFLFGLLQRTRALRPNLEQARRKTPFPAPAGHERTPNVARFIPHAPWNRTPCTQPAANCLSLETTVDQRAYQLTALQCFRLDFVRPRRVLSISLEVLFVV